MKYQWKKNKKKKGVYAFIIARRNIPSAIRAPTIAPMTATIPLVIVPTRFIIPVGVPMNDARIPAPQRKMTPTISPMIIRIAPTIRLFPDPK